MKNKSIVVDRPRSITLRETEQPTLKAGEALLRIRCVGVCGTDIHAFRGEQPFFEYPRILGHELAAEIVELAGSDSGFSVGQLVAVVPYLPCGDCVACRRERPNCCTQVRVLGVHIDGGMREYLTVPTSALVSAQGLDADHLALVECLAIGFHSVRRSQVQAGETALVLGAGPIGLGIVQAVKARGARVLVADVQEERLRFCQDTFGVDETLMVNADLGERLGECTGGDYPTMVFDATGNVRSMCQAVHYCAHGGTLVYVGLVKDEIRFAHPDFHKRELTLHASRNATHEDFSNVVSGLVDGSVESSCYITHRSSMDAFVDDFQKWAQPGSGVLKGLLVL